MVWTGFRPSDDAAQYGYNVPRTCSRSVALPELPTSRSTSGTTRRWRRDDDAARRHPDGINNYGDRLLRKYGYMYAYEVDGLGHSNLMDDANVPSLLSIPYLGYPAANAIYQNTRRFALSSG